ncbi:Uncharacterised protein [Vibrio cholerae]|nr:Uncharacterised protein [Vibrio cholerae]
MIGFVEATVFGETLERKAGCAFCVIDQGLIAIHLKT